MKKFRTQPCREDSPREDPFYGTRFREYALIALAIMLNALLIGLALRNLTLDSGWLSYSVDVLAAVFLGISAIAALFLIIGTYVQIRICLTHRRNYRYNTTNNPTIKH